MRKRAVPRESARMSDKDKYVNRTFPDNPPHLIEPTTTVAFADQMRASRWAALASWAARSGAMGARAKARAARGRPHADARTTISYGSKISGTSDLPR